MSDRCQQLGKLVQKSRFRRGQWAVDTGYLNDDLSYLQTDELKLKRFWPAAGSERSGGQLFFEDERQSTTSSAESGVGCRRSMNV